jgi:hypothetical protein
MNSNGSQAMSAIQNPHPDGTGRRGRLHAAAVVVSMGPAVVCNSRTAPRDPVSVVTDLLGGVRWVERRPCC